MANAININSTTPAAPAGNQNVTFQVDAASIPNISAYVPVLSFTPPLLESSNTISMPVATSSADGYLSHTDWATFNAKQAALTFPLTVAQGGTGETNASAARTNLGAAASGANSDITSLSGLTTPLSIAQGGTGASSAATALSNLGGIALSANNAFIGNNTFAGTTGLNGAVTLGAGLNLNGQTISGAGIFSGNLTFSAACYSSPNSPEYFNTSNVTWQEFQLITVKGSSAANDQLAIQYNTRSSSGGSDSWGSVFTIAAQTGALALNTATALNGAVTLNAGMNLNGQTLSGNATLSGSLTFNGAVAHNATLTLDATATATSSNNYGSEKATFLSSYYNSGAQTDTWVLYANVTGGAAPTSALTVSHTGGSTSGVYPLIIQQTAQAPLDLWNATTGGTPSTGSHWRLFADNVGRGGGSLTFGVYDVANSRLAFGIDNSGNATFIAKINTTLWNLQAVMGDTPGGLPVSASFTTHGGTVWITVSGSGYAATAGTIIGATISVDGTTRSTMKIFANAATTHLAFVPVTFILSGLTAGSHTIAIAALSGTTTDTNDFYNVDIIEFPF